MTAKELRVGDLFRRSGDWRIFQRLQGEERVIEGEKGVPVKPLQPTIAGLGGYVSSDETIFLFKEVSFRLS